jgi:hypothetical protein
MRTSRLPIALGASIALAPAARAGETEAWFFDVMTTGEDVHWVSPTGVRTDAARYLGQWIINQVVVTVQFLGLPIDVDVTSQVPPEQQTGAELLNGPLPLTIYQDSFVYPEPPEPPGLSATMHIGVNAEGHGFFDATDIFLGEIDVGFGDLPVLGIRVVGNLFVTPDGIYGDIDGDGVVGFGDLLIVLAEWGRCPAPPAECPADLTRDAEVGFNDLLAVLAAWSAK